MARGPTSKLRRRLIAFALGVFAALLLAEVAVRIFAAATAAARLDDSRARSAAAATPATGTTVRLGHLIRAARDPDVVYELVPGLDVEFQAVRTAINRDGFRGPVRARQKPRGSYRIVGLGDSVMFGWGVPYEDCGLARLEVLLRERLPSRVVETIDTAVPGYNTAIEAAVLRDKGLAFAPDLVVVDFVANDFDLPGFLWERPDYWRLDRSFLLGLVRRELSWRDADLHGPFVHAPADDSFGGSSVPPEYAHLVGPDAFRRALRAIADMGREHGFRVLVTCHRGLHPLARAACEELGVPTAESNDRIDAWLREHGHAAYERSPLSLGPDDPHPTAIVHGMWADATLSRLVELGWLPQ
jgi:hypothetical protein